MLKSRSRLLVNDPIQDLIQVHKAVYFERDMGNSWRVIIYKINPILSSVIFIENMSKSPTKNVKWTFWIILMFVVKRKSVFLSWQMLFEALLFSLLFTLWLTFIYFYNGVKSENIHIFLICQHGNQISLKMYLVTQRVCIPFLLFLLAEY